MSSAEHLPARPQDRSGVAGEAWVAGLAGLLGPPLSAADSGAVGEIVEGLIRDAIRSGVDQVPAAPGRLEPFDPGWSDDGADPDH